MIRLLTIGVILTIIILFSVMLSVSIQQSQSAAQAPESLLANPDASTSNWDEYYIHVDNNAYYLNTPDIEYFGNTPLTFEVVFSGCSPQNTGALISTTLTIYLPPEWMDYSVTPPKPYFTTTCLFGESLLTVTPESTISEQTSAVTYLLRSGSYLQYPFDHYKQTTSFYCSYDLSSYNLKYNRSISPVNSYLFFNIRLAKPDVGLFSHTQVYNGVNQYINVQYTTINNITTASNYTYYSYPSLDVRFTRATINQIFPMFITIAMWMIVLGQTIVFLPYYLGLKIADGNAIPMAGKLRPFI
jgi:hypothetical protein